MTANQHYRRDNKPLNHLHQSTDDLRKKVKMQRLLGQKTLPVSKDVGMDAFNAEYSTTYEIDKSTGQSITRDLKST